MYINYKHRIFGLDVIRAAAIILVLLSHTTLLLFPDKENTLLTIIRFFGTIGVDLFFVLSGFLIGGIILKQLTLEKTALKDFVHFWIRRWFRTLPNYFLILILNIFLVYVFYGEIVNGISHYFIFLQNFSEEQPNFFTESWSLSIEEYAYIVGPCLLYFLVLISKGIPKHLLYLCVTVLIILCVTLFRYHFHVNNVISSGQQWSHQLRKVVIYRVDSIYYGFIGAYFFMYFKPIWERYKKHLFYLAFVIFIGLHTIIFVYHISPENTSLFYNIFYLPIVSISLLLFFPLATSLKNESILKSKITKISILSYAIYLINYSIVLLSIQYFIDVSQASFIIKIVILFMYWLLSYQLSYLLFVYFERPTTNLRDKNFFKTRID
ncbi:Acyltransferase family protein [Mariniflexile rhizosphaerae]|uniref:acyltransferase family protein n=1 Tax=unclassified Mariniflexile TaxID=2643887 RepID=UPI000CB1CD50|nr:acyltransferase [Mariniflexile sp. TRM1-10]AXP81947.1 Acyltransferase family protein [Mariniflexile sp. TRM1-10]PLB18030.1 MAG: Acyltransferase family protein [Flavobacteriaceae bacterium FS1-H7996/R]